MANPLPLNAPFEDDYDDLLEPVAAVQSLNFHQRVEQELTVYHMENGLPMRRADGVHIDPFLWWKDRVQLLPTLSRLARRYLCIPATSAPSERVLSHDGLTIANARANLLPDNAAAAIFLHDAWHVMDDLDERPPTQTCELNDPRQKGRV